MGVLEIKDDKITLAGRVEVGPEPRGVALSADGSTAYVAIGVNNEVARVDLKAAQGDRPAAGRPGTARTCPHARRVARCWWVTHRSQNVSLIDVKSWKVKSTIPIDGDNLRQVAISADGKTGYIANMRNRRFATTRNNIDLGWVLGQRLTRVPLDGSVTYDTLSLDTQGKAVSDAHGVAVSRDEKFLAIGFGGTHEVMIFRTDLKRLPWRTDGSRDLIAAELLKKDGRLRRVELGGRPTELAFAPDGKTLYVANYLADAVQVVDAETAQLVKTIPLGGPKTAVARAARRDPVSRG